MPLIQEITTSATIPLAIPMMLFACRFTLNEASLQLRVCISGFLSVFVAVVVGYLFFGKHISEIRLFLVKKGKKSGLAAGVFPVGSSDKVDACIAGSSYVGNYDIVAGEVTLEEHEEGWKLTFDVTDAKGKNWKGTYIGPLLTKAEVEG